MDSPHYNLIGLTFEPTVASLHLRRSYGLNNMILVDNRGYPDVYRTVSEILEAYYVSMIELIQQLIATKISEAETKIRTLTERMRFVNLVLNGTIVVQKVSKKQVHAEMDRQDPPIDHEIFNGLGLSALTIEGLEDLQHKIVLETNKIKEIQGQTPQNVWLTWLKSLVTVLPAE